MDLKYKEIEELEQELLDLQKNETFSQKVSRIFDTYIVYPYMSMVWTNYNSFPKKVKHVFIAFLKEIGYSYDIQYLIDLEFPSKK